MNKNIETIKYPRGSEWRKWDLHLHTPSSFDYGNKSITDNQLIDVVKKRDLSVVAITDHHYMDVERIRNLQKIAGDEVKILPGLELRTDKGGSESVHIIGIFPDDLNNLDSVWDKIKGKLNLTEADITKVGGDDCAFCNLENACDVIHGCGGIVSIHAGKKDNSIENITNALSFKMALKKEILEHIDIFEVGSKKEQEEYEEKVYPNIKKTPPIIVCSDNHNIRDYRDKDETWIKANPNFEGLKQILYEKERVYIGTEAPERADASKVIKSVKIENANSWFEDKDVFLNPWSVSVIGGKGTGKTALLDLIALTANKNWDEFKDNDNSFLTKAKNELGNLAIKIKWGDNSDDECKLKDFFSNGLKDDGDEKVIYLSQGFISHLCSKPGELQKQIEDVIYQNVENEDRAIYTNFEEYRNSRLGTVTIRQNEIKQKITAVNRKIDNCVKLISDEKENDKSIEIKSREVDRIDKEIKKISTGLKEDKNKKIFNDYQKAEISKAEFEKEISKLSEEARNVDIILEKIDFLKNEFGDSIVEVNELLEVLGIKKNVSIKVLPENITTLLNEKKKQNKEAITEKTKELKAVKEKIDSLAKQLEFEKSKQEKLSELNELFKKATERKASLLEKKGKIKNAKVDIEDYKEEQTKLFDSFFVTLFQEKEILEDIYNPLEAILESSEEENKKFFRFSVKLDFDFDAMANKGYPLIDRRKTGRYKNRDKDFLLQDLKDKKENNFILDFALELEGKNLSKDNNESISSFRESLLGLFNDGNVDNLDLHIKSMLNSEYTIKDFYDWIFSTDYYRLSYSIKFNDKDLHSLSPGLKGVALLILYLELDRDNNKPILIDQPEENLDNRFIFNTLVKYFRSAKKRRQIIIATHNANLVVNTDSEQVFVANFDKDKKEQDKYISYVSGAIEDTFQNNEEKVFLKKCGVKEHIIDVLEGSEDAFKKREERYNLS